MATKKDTLTKKDLITIKQLLEQEIGLLVKDMIAAHESNKELLEENRKLTEEFKKIALKIEKISINSELMYETFLDVMVLDVMVLVKLHNKKIRDLEKQLALHREH